MNISDKIPEIFSSIREDKNAPWQKDNFMEFLIITNGKSLDNSFKGKRFKNRFINQVQLELAVCFPNNGHDKKWNLDEFVDYVEKRHKNIPDNLKMAQKRLQGAKGADVNLLVFMNAILIPIFFLSSAPYNLVYLAVLVLLNALLIKFKISDIAYHKQLVKVISSQK